MRIRLPQAIGVELPRSGNGTRQATFSFVLQRSGRFFSAATPLPPGPRHPGQFAPGTGEVSATNPKTAQPNLRATDRCACLPDMVCSQECRKPGRIEKPKMELTPSSTLSIHSFVAGCAQSDLGGCT